MLVALQVLVLAFAAAACAALVHAGAREGRGDLESARRIARPAGFLAACAALAQLALAVAWTWSGSASTWGIIGALAVIASGWAALLAGLSGKPRPTGWAAAVLVVCGIVGWAIALSSWF